MKFARTIPLAIHALRRNILRATLTVLGIVIGIAAVIVMMEIGRGSSTAIQKTIASMGANNLMVTPGTAASGGVSFGAGSVLTLTTKDAESIRQQISGIRAIAPVVRTRAQVVYGNRNWVPMTVYGTTPEFLVTRDWYTLAEGDVFSERDIAIGARVCLIGQTLVRELFQNNSPLGKEIRLKNVAFRVVGVLSAKGANMMGLDQDDIFLAPWTTIKYRISSSSSDSTSQTSSSGETDQTSNSLYPSTSVPFYPSGSTSELADRPHTPKFPNIDQIVIAANSPQDIPNIITQVESLLRERHHIHANEASDFAIRDMAEMTNALTSTTSLMTKLLLSVALISLVVGGVGIMNIMLVSVTERTKEIGLRMAVGAKGKDILRQFLVEAVVLCLSGGILGILLGTGISQCVAWFLRWPIESSLDAVVASFLVSASVGIIFGFYPAWKASSLDPIEALRYE